MPTPQLPENAFAGLEALLCELNIETSLRDERKGSFPAARAWYDSDRLAAERRNRRPKNGLYQLVSRWGLIDRALAMAIGEETRIAAKQKRKQVRRYKRRARAAGKAVDDAPARGWARARLHTWRLRRKRAARAARLRGFAAWRDAILRAYEEHLVAERNAKLTDYRARAFGSQKDFGQKPKLNPLTTRVFAYVHGEFGFNAPRPIGRIARVTHLVFAPLFTEKTCKDEPVETLRGRLSDVLRRLLLRREPGADPLKTIGPVTNATLAWLWRRALQDPILIEGHAQAPATPDRETLSFRGAQEAYFEDTKEPFDFSEPFITPMRSIMARRNLVTAAAAQNANSSSSVVAEENGKIEAERAVAGQSHRVANIVEYFYKYDCWEASPGRMADEIAYVRWARHGRPYQTFTFSHEMPDLKDVSVDGGGGDPFGTTALHAFPGDFFADGGAGAEAFAGVFGRFMQGANWLVLPFETFLEGQDSPGSETLTALREFAREFRAHSGNARAKRTLEALCDTKAMPSHRDIRAIFDLANLDQPMAAEIDRLVIDAVRPFVAKCFSCEPDRDSVPDKVDDEIIGIKCMDGRAYIFANLRHPTQIEGNEMRSVFTRSVIIDCGMQKFQRGRLLQAMTEFTTERTMALRWIARFRLLHSALSAIEAKLNQAASNYHNSRSQFSSEADEDESVVPFAYWSRHPHPDPANRSDLSVRERELIIALEFLSSCLSLMHDVVEGGMTDRATGTLGSVVSLREKLSAIRETPLIGHLSLSGFLERRFIPATRVISRAGDRYQALRARITSVAELINATLSAKEWYESQEQMGRQVTLLTFAEFVGAAAGCYYLSVLIVHFMTHYCSPPLADARCDMGDVEPLVYGSALTLMLVLWTISATRYFLERREIRRRRKGARLHGGEL